MGATTSCCGEHVASSTATQIPSIGQLATVEGAVVPDDPNLDVALLAESVSVSEEWQNQLNSLPICPINGCSYAFLKDFEGGGLHGPHALQGDDFNIGNLCIQVIKPFTTIPRPHPLTCSEIIEYYSYAEVGFQTDLFDSRGRPAFHLEACHFVSHAWRYRFYVFVGALRNWLDMNDANEDEQYFWVDAFVVNQHQAQEYPMEWWSTRFAAAVGEIGSTIMIAEPWDDPLPLKRVWVIWELYCTNQTGARLHLAMTKGTSEDFKSALTNDFEKVSSVISSVDVSTCTAYHQSHTDMVHTEIKRTIGFAKLNEMVSLRLTQWLIETATIELNKLKATVDRSDKKALLDTFKLHDNLARMVRESGSPLEAETLFIALLEEARRDLGVEDNLVLNCLNQLAVTHQKAKKPDDALERHRECYDLRKRILGTSHEDTLQSISNLAVLLSDNKPLATSSWHEAKNLYDLAIQGREATIGEKHPRTLYTVSNLAKLLTEAPEKLDKAELFLEAEKLHSRAVTSLEQTLQQEGHPLMLAAKHNQAAHWLERYIFVNDGSGKDMHLLEQALKQLTHVHNLRLQKLGDSHPDTILTEGLLMKAEARRQNSRFVKAGAVGGSNTSWAAAKRREFDRMCTCPSFKKIRDQMRLEGIDKLRNELVEGGYIDPRTNCLTVGTQPFNIFARLASGVQVQRRVPPEQYKLGQFSERYLIAHNKPECREMWERSDPTWLGKAGMSKNHVFLLSKNMHWTNFNVLTMGLARQNVQTAIMMLEDMKKAAYHWVKNSDGEGWPPPERIGLYVAVYPLTNVPAFHMHIVDMDNKGPSFAKLSYKMLAIDDVLAVLRIEAEVPPPVSAFVEAFKRGSRVTAGAGKDGNKDILAMLDEHFPELKIYRDGKVYTSPGVVEIEGSPTEYYRTVGAVLAFLAAYAFAKGDEEFGLEVVAGGERGPMSMDKVPGKFINMGNKPKEYADFCNRFAETMKDEQDWWSMLIFLAVHDVGKSVKFRDRVNSTLPKKLQTDDHDRVLAYCLADIHLTAELLPSVYKMSYDRQAKILAGFATNFQLPQMGQGEVTVKSLNGLLHLPEDHLHDGTLKNYLYHSIFDIAGGPCNERFIFPLALVPVYIGFGTAMEDLCSTLQKGEDIKDYALYTNFLFTNFKKAYPDFVEQKFQSRCQDSNFVRSTGLVVLRILALTRNTYKNPDALMSLLENSYPQVVSEMAGTAGDPQIMVYYGPDMLRMGLGEDLEDKSGDNMQAALSALEHIFALVRSDCQKSGLEDSPQYDLNVTPIVTAIKKAGKDWQGGKQLLEVAKKAVVKSNAHCTEGILDIT